MEPFYTLCLARLKKMFPHLSSQMIQTLRRGDQVDVLIGAKHASWQPDRAEKVQGRGDLWMYRWKYGICYGGSCPDIEERTEKSSDLFHVNQTYNLQCVVQRPITQSSSHELEFCEKRVVLALSEVWFTMEFCEKMEVLALSEEYAVSPEDVTRILASLK